MGRAIDVGTVMPALALALLALSGAPADAGIGGSIDGDRARIAVHMTKAIKSSHVAYTMETASGGTVREYATADGVVFAVAWQGRARPDLRQLLGDHFADYQGQMQARRGRRLVRHVELRQSGLVVHSAGHPGAFWGEAYDPRLVPAGFTFDAQ